MKLLSLVEMSVSGGVLILAVMLVRALALDKLPKGAFLALWALAAARLLVPVGIPSALSVWTLAGEPLRQEIVEIPPQENLMWIKPSAVVTPENPVPDPVVPALPAMPDAQVPAETEKLDFPVWTAVWLAGLCLCAGFYLLTYLRCRRAFREAVPAEAEAVERCLAERPLGRRIQVRQWDRGTGPMTYGILQPVILLPSNTDWSDQERLSYVLEHEMVHIRRLDGLFKLVLAAAACVHWFNPLAWAMLALANRDIELSCDEAVVRRCGLDRRSAYAMTLIDLEEQKSGLGPFASAFSKNNMEERIRSIMKLKKTSLLAAVLAAVLVCGLGAAFATSAAEEPNLRSSLTVIPSKNYSEEESRKLFSLWIEGYEGMTVTAFREKMRGERTDADMALIERFSLDGYVYELPAGKEADALTAFNDYFFTVYEPLTADHWQTWSFDGNGADGAQYLCDLTVLDGNALTVGEYEEIRQKAEAVLRQSTGGAADIAAVEALSTKALRVEAHFYGPGADAALYEGVSNAVSSDWDSLLTPYLPFGLTYTFDDPDHDGNGLTMWFEGKEVRGIYDEQEGVWITEHTGNGFSDGAVELYTVYTGGTLTGLRLATPEEQTGYDAIRDRNTAAQPNDWEEREFPNATREDYDAILALRELDLEEDRPLDPMVLAMSYRQADYSDLSLRDFNQKLLDWANENTDAWNRISCDVIWDDYAVELTEEEKAFVSLTCNLSGTENGQKIRALYTGGEPEDPGFAANLPMLQYVENSVTTAWCDLYYDLSYHVSDPAAVTVGERDRCVGAMKQAVYDFWWDTPMDELLSMTKEEVVERFNAWAADCGTDHVSFCHVTGDHLHYECVDERSHHDEEHHTEGHHAGHHA